MRNPLLAACSALLVGYGAALAESPNLGKTREPGTCSVLRSASVLLSNRAARRFTDTRSDSGEIRLEVAEEEPEGAARDYDVMIVEDTGGPDNRLPATIATKYQDAAKSGLKVTMQSKREE